jgi:hypothetical protein
LYFKGGHEWAGLDSSQVDDIRVMELRFVKSHLSKQR